MEHETSSGFETSVVHLYRGEMNRMTVWRQRLDVTSNWGVLLSVALTTFTLGSVDVPHYTLLLGLAVIAISLLLEGRRYRHLYHSKWRLWVLEAGYFGDLLDPPDQPGRWREVLARDLRQPTFAISWFTAVRVRLRRNYLMILYFVTAVWVVKLFIHPARPGSWAEFYRRFAVGDLIPSWFVIATALLFVLSATVLAFACPASEEVEDWSRDAASRCS